MKTLSKEQVLRLHNALLETFGGTAGIRDDGLLESALNAPFATFGGQYAQAYHCGRVGSTARCVTALPEMPGTTSSGFT